MPTADPVARWQAFHLVKAGNAPTEYEGVLAQAYALKYQSNLSHLVLCSTFSSTKAMNQVFARMKERMAPELRNWCKYARCAGP